MTLRSRQHGQSVVEFGIIAILFTLIMFAVCDFGLLLNDWLSVSSNARLLARDAAVGMTQADLDTEAKTLAVPGVTADAFPGGYCCGPNASLRVNVTFYNHCTPTVAGCTTIDSSPTQLAQLDSRYWSNGHQGGCTATVTAPCAHPSPPKNAVNCNGAGTTCPGDTVVVTVTAAGAQVITPLVRPFFTNPTTCPSNSAHCYVSLTSSVSMRFEGDTL